MIPYFYMDNFFFGLQAVTSGAIDVVRRVATYKLFWGFSLGFLVSTILHGFLLTDHPMYLPDMILKDHATSFQKIFPPDKQHTYRQSFQLYVKNVDKIKFVFALSGFLFALLILFVLLSW